MKKIEHILLNEVECKRCATCKEYKPLSDFHKGKFWDKLYPRCKPCRSSINLTKYKQKQHEAYIKRYVPIVMPEFVKCIVCGIEFKPNKTGNEKYCSGNCRFVHFTKTEKGQISRRATHHKRRVNISPLEKLTPFIIKEIYDSNINKYNKLTCVYCFSPCEDNWHLDHIIPLVKGGTNNKSNLTISCPWCNLSKGSKTVEEFVSVKEVIE